MQAGGKHQPSLSLHTSAHDDAPHQEHTHAVKLHTQTGPLEEGARERERENKSVASSKLGTLPFEKEGSWFRILSEPRAVPVDVKRLRERLLAHAHVVHCMGRECVHASP